MKKTPTLILDCDGVILDSNLLKVEVVRKVLLEMPQMFPNNKVEAAVKALNVILVNQGTGMLKICKII